MDAGNGAADVSIPISLLLGDTNANGVVNATGISEANDQSGLTTNGGNFRLDINVNGAVNSPDISQIKAKAGTALPPVSDQSVSP